MSLLTKLPKVTKPTVIEQIRELGIGVNDAIYRREYNSNGWQDYVLVLCRVGTTKCFWRLWKRQSGNLNWDFAGESPTWTLAHDVWYKIKDFAVFMRDKSADPTTAPSEETDGPRWIFKEGRVAPGNFCDRKLGHTFSASSNTNMVSLCGQLNGYEGLVRSYKEALDVAKADQLSDRNMIEILKEDLDVVHKTLDDLEAPRADERGSEYSIVGRIHMLLHQRDQRHAEALEALQTESKISDEAGLLVLPLSKRILYVVENGLVYVRGFRGDLIGALPVEDSGYKTSPDFGFVKDEKPKIVQWLKKIGQVQAADCLERFAVVYIPETRDDISTIVIVNSVTAAVLPGYGFPASKEGREHANAVCDLLNKNMNETHTETNRR